MRYHNITHDDMLNGDGLRVVLWLAGCDHHCKGCQNPVTWNPDDGLEFTTAELTEIEKELEKTWISGVTISGGDGLYEKWRPELEMILRYLKKKYPTKSVWAYTGYSWEEVKHLSIMKYIDVLADGEYIEKLRDTKKHWVGSSNQRVIDVQRSLKYGCALKWGDSNGIQTT